MAKRIEVNLFGKNGQRSLEIQPRGGFPTRHIKVPLKPVPSIFSPVTPEMVEVERKAKHEKPPIIPCPDPKPQSQPDPVVDPEAVFDVLQKMTQDANPKTVDHDWFIIDEILFVSTAQCGIRANHSTLLDALRDLYQQGQVAHKTNQFQQHMFKLIEGEKTDLHALLAEVDEIMGGTPDA